MRFLPLYSSAATAKSIKSCVYNFLNAHSRIFHRLVSVDSDGPTFREFYRFSVQGRRTSWVAIDFRLLKALSSRAHGNREMLPGNFGLCTRPENQPYEMSSFSQGQKNVTAF